MKAIIKGKILPILITLIGVGLILQAAGNVALGFIGERGNAVITHVRREGGERNDTVPNRYTYIISYTFKTPDGRLVDGFSRHIGGAVYGKATGKQQIPVRYLKQLPVINTLEKDAQFSWGNAVLLSAGVFLVFAVHRPARRARFFRNALSIKSKNAIHAEAHQTIEGKGVLIGYSDKIRDPAFARYIKDTNQWSFLFSAVLGVIAVTGFYIYGETSKEISNPEAIYIGCGIGSMFMGIATIQIISRQRSKTWDGVVVNKRVEQKQRRRNNGNDDYDWEMYTLYAVVIRSEDGKMHTIAVENDDTYYQYYQIGDSVRHHKGLNSYEKYDKSKDTVIFCNACASLNDIKDEYCFRCKCPLLK